MNYFYMTAGGSVTDSLKRDECYVYSLDATIADEYVPYNTKLSDICLWLAVNAAEFQVGVCYGKEHGEAMEYLYEICIHDDQEAIQFKLSLV